MILKEFYKKFKSKSLGTFVFAFVATLVMSTVSVNGQSTIQFETYDVSRISPAPTSRTSISISNEKDAKNESCVDIDGNTYETIMIGEQLWMAENLKVTHYNDGTEIPNITDVSWSTLSSGAYAEYDNDQSNVDIYGRLYNWHAVSASAGLCPCGWHVPTDSEWKTLEIYLGMTEEQANETGFRGTDEGGKLKEEGTEHWDAPNSGATNSSGFTALPGGMKHINGDFYDINVFGCFWSSTENDVPDSPTAWDRFLRCNMPSVHRANGGNHKSYGFSVRCVSNTTIVSIDDNNKDSEFNGIQIYPNPFYSSVIIVTPENSIVEIFDINGKLIERLKWGEQEWTPEDYVLEGFYFIQVKKDNYTFVRKISYLKW